MVRMGCLRKKAHVFSGTMAYASSYPFNRHNYREYPLPPPSTVQSSGVRDYIILSILALMEFTDYCGNYILNYVASQPKLAPFVIQALIQVIAKITKLGWFEVQKDQLVFREIIADVKKFLQGTVEHCIIGVMILSELTQEMNLVLAKPLNLQDQGQQNLVMQVLKLVLSCLSFDFIGSSADESADDLCTVQIPTTWRTSKKKVEFESWSA
ncbi:hypothetical protein CB1_016033001 [Camelus ferus]|nr:hypothetical protein CB1_016033001 [Camelus ferus]